MSGDRLLSGLKESESLKENAKPRTNFSKARIEKIRKEFSKSRHKLFKSKINKIRRKFYDIKNKKNFLNQK